MQPRKHIGEPSLRIDVVKFRALDQRVDGSRAPAALIRAGESPVVAPTATQRSARTEIAA